MMKLLLLFFVCFSALNTIANESCIKTALMNTTLEAEKQFAIQSTSYSSIIDQSSSKVLKESKIFESQDISKLIVHIKKLLSDNPDKKIKLKLKKELEKLRKIQKREGNLSLVGRDNISVIKRKDYFVVKIKLGKKFHKIEMKMDENLSNEENKKFMAKMIAYFSLTPKKIISSIDKIEIHASTHEDHSTYLALSEYLSHFRNKQKYYRVEYKNETYHTLETDYGMLTYFHELGHAYTNKRFGEKIPPGYKQAVEVDKNSVSKYGDTNIQEDFAETFALYLLLRNTKSTDPTAFSKISKSLFEKRTDGVFHLVSEKINKSTSEITPDDVRKMYVNRFKIIDGLLEKDPTLKDRFLLHLDKNPIVQASLVGAIGVGAFVILIQSTLDK